MTTIARLDVMAPTQGGSPPGQHPLPINLDASQHHHAAITELLTWARHVADATCTALPTHNPQEHYLATLTKWLAGRLEWLRARPEAAEAMDGITTACRAIVRVVDRRPDRWYAGVCGANTMTGRCEEELRPVAGAQTIRCECGAQHDAAARRAWLLDLLAEEWLPAVQCAHVLARLGQPVPVNTIYSWARRSQLLAHPNSPPARPHYRVGSIMELADSARVGKRLTPV